MIAGKMSSLGILAAAGVWAVGLTALSPLQASAAEQAMSKSGEASEKGVRQRIKELEQTQQRMLELEQKIKQIEQETVEADPELAERRSEFQSKLKRAMKEGTGFDVDKSREEVEKLTKRLEDEELDEKKRKQALQELRTHREAAQHAREKALEQESVREAQKALREDLLAAMKEHNPETQKLLEEIERTAERVEELRRELREEATSLGSAPSGAGGASGS